MSMGWYLCVVCMCVRARVGGGEGRGGAGEVVRMGGAATRGYERGGEIFEG